MRHSLIRNTLNDLGAIGGRDSGALSEHSREILREVYKMRVSRHVATQQC